MRRNKLLLIVILSLLFPTTVSACGTSSDSLHPADPKEGKIPPIFGQLKNYRKVNADNYLVSYLDSGDMRAGYFFKAKIKNAEIKCSLSIKDEVASPISCEGKFPPIKGLIKGDSNNLLYISDGDNSIERIKNQKNISYVWPKDVNPKVLFPGHYIKTYGSTDIENIKPSSNTCVVKQNIISCINSYKHGFSIDADGTHIF